MYYYGYQGGYNNYYPTYGGYGNYGYGCGNSYGYTGAIILVLFILLVVVFGAGFLNNGCCNN